jgi:hypothetical protein
MQVSHENPLRTAPERFRGYSIYAKTLNVERVGPQRVGEQMLLRRSYICDFAPVLAIVFGEADPPSQ